MLCAERVPAVAPKYITYVHFEHGCIACASTRYAARYKNVRTGMMRCTFSPEVSPNAV